MILVLGVILSVILAKEIGEYQDVNSSTFSQSQCGVEPASPSHSTVSISSSRSIGYANYDLQIASIFVQNFSKLEYNVTATAQNDGWGYGPVYLLNGLTDKGYWFQVGLQWNLALSNRTRFVPGFEMSYQVWPPNGGSIFPITGGIGYLPFSAPVSNEDAVLLSLEFSAGNIAMSAYDWNSSAASQIIYSAYGSKFFAGSVLPESHFTGLMTEWYHVCPTLSNPKRIIYFNHITPIRQSFICVDEWNFSAVNYSSELNSSSLPAVVYSNCSSAPLDFSGRPNELQSFRSNGLTIYENATEFVNF